MANGNSGPTKAELQETLDQVEKILSDVYQPESDRESLAAAVGDALGVIQGEDGDEDEDDDEDGDDRD